MKARSLAHASAPVLGLAAVYAVVGRLGLTVGPVHAFATLVWPPTGIALAALLLGGSRRWPGVAIGAFIVNAWVGAPIPAALGIAAGNTLEAVVGATLVRRVSGPTWSMDRVRDLVAFVALGALLSTAISATLGVASLAAARVIATGDVAETWRAWWLGDVLGDLVVASPLLAWRRSVGRPLSGRWREGALLGSALLATVALVFFLPPAAPPTGFVEACLLLPLLVWAALRSGMRGGTAAVLLVSAAATLGTASGLGPFALGTTSSGLVHLQSFMAVVSLAVLVVGAVTGEREAALRSCARAEASLREANERLLDADHRKDEFLGMLSHELRNPLAPIRNSVYILNHRSPSPEQAARARAIIDRQTEHLARLVDDLLDVTRVARGKVTLQTSALDLVGLTRRTAEDHRALMLERGLELALDLPPGPVTVSGDETRLAQVLGNLLSNAAKFSPDGGRVTVTIETDGPRAHLRVRDTGSGIDPALLGAIFDPFTQAKQTLARTEGGLGLGLALVKGLVALHGGEVAAASEGAGRGAEFSVTLPTAGPRPDAAGAARSATTPP